MNKAFARIKRGLQQAIRRRRAALEINPIRTKADYRAVLKEIETLMAARPGTREGERLDVLVTLVEAWEKKRMPSNELRAVATPRGSR